MKNKRFIYGYTIILLLVLTVILYRDRLVIFNKQAIFKPNTVEKMPTNFNECLASGFPIQESYPRRCVLNNGQTFSEDIGNELEKTNLIIVDSPRPNSNVNNIITISGRARGTWFFEASFPINLVDSNNQIVASTIAQAKSNWMTEEFVPFEAKLTIPATSIGQAKLILKKDNPSGNSALDDQLMIPVNILN